MINSLEEYLLIHTSQSSNSCCYLI